MQTPIDYDRGCISRVAQQFGIEVFMYRDDPGVYYAANGQKLPTAIAASAGFDTAVHAIKRRAKEQVASAHAKLEAEIAQVGKGQRNVVGEYGEFKVVALGVGRHVVENGDGLVLTKGIHLDEAMARKLAEDMAAENPSDYAPAAAGDGVDGGRAAGVDGRRARKVAP